MRLLDELGIRYETRAYDVDLNDLSAIAVAEKIGLPPQQVFKTLVVRGDSTGVAFAVVPGNREIDFKALARLSGNRKVEMAALKDVQSLTGYVRGGVTAFGGRRDYPVFLDESALHCEPISISAGIRGVQLLLNPSDYSGVVNATSGKITKADL